MAVMHHNWSLLGDLAIEPQSRHVRFEVTVASAFGASLVWAACASTVALDPPWRVAGFLVIAGAVGYAATPSSALVAGVVIGLFVQGFGYATGGVIDGSMVVFAHVGLGCAGALAASLVGRERRVSSRSGDEQP
ncbi:MAG: hypothetical protein GC156_11580 [Actinomycetales bacterium]|nr:hypothetical protein [Actinomycetales bacterium]